MAPDHGESAPPDEDAAVRRFIVAAESMLALAADMNDGLLTHADAYYAVENFARHGAPYEREEAIDG